MWEPRTAGEYFRVAYGLPDPRDQADGDPDFRRSEWLPSELQAYELARHVRRAGGHVFDIERMEVPAAVAGGQVGPDMASPGGQI